MERLRQGQRPSIEEYAAQHPDLAEEIRELFPDHRHHRTVEGAASAVQRRARDAGARRDWSGWATSGSSAKLGVEAWAWSSRRSRNPWGAGWPSRFSLGRCCWTRSTSTIPARGPHCGQSASHEYRRSLRRGGAGRFSLLRDAIHSRRRAGRRYSCAREAGMPARSAFRLSRPAPQAASAATENAIGRGCRAAIARRRGWTPS